MVPAPRAGPGQALWKRRIVATTPTAFCAALLGNIRYALPADVPATTWKVALQYFAERQLPEAAFRRLLEQRAARDRAAPATPGGADAGARVAAYLLREWEHYQLARQMAPTGPGRRAGGRAGAPRRQSFRRSSRDRAAQVALLQRLGMPVPARQQTRTRRARGTPPPAQADMGD
jgi:hypothetical protein